MYQTYEICWEWSGSSNSRFVRARSEAEAIARLREDWSDCGDEPPPVAAFWCVGTWSVNA